MIVGSMYTRIKQQTQLKGSRFYFFFQTFFFSGTGSIPIDR